MAPPILNLITPPELAPFKRDHKHKNRTTLTPSKIGLKKVTDGQTDGQTVNIRDFFFKKIPYVNGLSVRLSVCYL